MGSAARGSDAWSAAVLLAGTLLCAVAIAAMLARSTRRNWPDVLTVTGIAAALLAALHDALRPLLDGSPFTALIPFAGVLTLAALGTSGARRLLTTLAEAETLNATLEDRISAASAGLEASEAARRALEISTAITRERERLMREIHDGIGSSLVTTIAVSERLQKETTSAVVLKRALTDLRIAVDSLEPVQGNAATLLASLRYRVEPDFRRAGISFVWKVDAVPAIAWLDAVNALHVLRIFQEALGNIAIHSGASEVTVVCRAEDADGEPGVLIDVRDNGKGLAATPESRGHGLDNMEQRARALGGRFAIEGKAGSGTSVSLWLPLRRADDW
jgi:signal transduction histidine kinase